MAELSTEAIRCTYQHTLYQKDDKSYCAFIYRDADTGKVFTAVGSHLCEERKLLVELSGNWGFDKKGKKQFKVLFYDIPPQETKAGVIAYLGSLKCGIGKKKAELVYDTFGEKTWEILDRNPNRLEEVRGIGSLTVRDIKVALKQNMQQRKLIVLFTKANVPISAFQANAIIALYGHESYETVKSNPFCLCGTVEGMTFERCDAVAELLELPLDDPNRLKAYVFKLLQSAAHSGNVCMHKDDLIEGMVNHLGCTREQSIEALKAAWYEGLIKNSGDIIYTRHHFEEEVQIAQSIFRIMGADFDPIDDVERLIDEYEAENSIKLAENQRLAVSTAFRCPFSVITGGPGVGKTTVIKAVLAVHKRVYGNSSNPILMAPTGKAARRMTAATGFPASTIHAEVGYKNEEECEDPNLVIKGNLVIVDEVSMMDQLIASVLLKKIQPESRLILVGDPDQLPSVGCGNVLHDIIASKVVPITRLDVIYRQAGTNPIVENAKRIHDGRTDLVYDRSFKFLECGAGEETFNTACNFYLRCVRAYGIDNVLLLNPQRNNTSVSVNAFNQTLQNYLNPAKEGSDEIKIGRNTFRKGDKVMQLKNTEAAKNGDTGYIRDIRKREDENDPGTYITEAMIEFNGDGVLRPYNIEAMRELDLAYCSTVHKSQGEEFKNVILVVSNDHHSLLKRNLVYTGITRAKENVALIGQPEALTISINDDRVQQRLTLLAQRLRKYLPQPA